MLTGARLADLNKTLIYSIQIMMEEGIRKELHRVLDKMIDENEHVGIVSVVNPVFEDGKVFRYEKYEYILNYFTRKDDLF